MALSGQSERPGACVAVAAAIMTVLCVTVAALSEQSTFSSLLQTAIIGLVIFAVVPTGLLTGYRLAYRNRRAGAATERPLDLMRLTGEAPAATLEPSASDGSGVPMDETEAPQIGETSRQDPSSPSTKQDLQTALRLFGSAIIDEVDTSVGTVLKENDQMRDMAREMASASAQAREQFQASMERATEAETGIEQVNAFSGELTSSIEVIGSAVRSSITIVKDVTAQAAVTRSCVDSMAQLSGAVGDCVELIDAIARQSRMLALNATIEAARAGDAGKGFRVVAQEVDLLARRTGAATQTISNKIDQMTGMVSNSVAALQALTVTIESIDSASTEIGRAVAEQEGLVDRVSTSLEDMRTGVFTLSREIREAAQIAANSGMLSDLVLETANSVDALMTGLKEKLQNIGASMDPLSSTQHDDSDHDV